MNTVSARFANMCRELIDVDEEEADAFFLQRCRAGERYRAARRRPELVKALTIVDINVTIADDGIPQGRRRLQMSDHVFAAKAKNV